MPRREDGAGPTPPTARKKARTQAEIERDRALVSEYMLRSWPLARIAVQMHLSPQQIKHEFQVIQRRWRESQLINYNAARQRELERIDLIESSAWDAWENSKSERKSTRTRQRTLPAMPNLPALPPVPPDAMPSLLQFPGAQNAAAAAAERMEKEAMVRIDQRDPDPRFLQLVQWCVEQRAKIYGLYPDSVRAPEREDDQPVRRVVVYMERGAEDHEPLPPGPGPVYDVQPRAPDAQEVNDAG